MPIASEADGEIILYQTYCTIFQAINKHAVSGNIEVLCHSGYTEEVNKIITNLVTLCNEKFGQQTTKRFTQEAVEEATIQMHASCTPE